MATTTTTPPPIFSAKFYFRHAEDGQYYGGKRILTADANSTLEKMKLAGAFPMASIQDAGHAYALWLDHITKIDRELLTPALRRIVSKSPLDGALDVVVADGTLTRYLLGPAAAFPEVEPRLAMDDKNVVAKLPAAAARRYLVTRMTRQPVPATPQHTAAMPTWPTTLWWGLRGIISLSALYVAATAAWQFCCSSSSSSNRNRNSNNDATTAATTATNDYSSLDWWTTVASTCAIGNDEL